MCYAVSVSADPLGAYYRYAFERPLFLHALAETGGNQLRAARLLGINRNTLRKRLSDLAIDPDEVASART